MSSYKTIGLAYHERMKFNVLPLRGKKPNILWDRWQSEIQSNSDIEKMDWRNATGLGGIMGINDLRAIDFDGVEDYEIVDRILCDLGLPEKYSWVIQSGSGEGFHIYFRTPHPDHLLQLAAGQASEEGVNEAKFDNNPFARIGGEKGVYKFKLKEDGYCKHIELRWRDCQTVLPPSMHESGGRYNYYYSDPKEEPIQIELEKVIECMLKNCIVEMRKTNIVSGDKKDKSKKYEDEEIKEERFFYDKDRLESALDYLADNLKDGSYDEWYKIGFALVPLGKAGEDYFVKMSLGNKNYSDSEKNIRDKFGKLISDYDGRITLGTIYHIAEMHGWKKPIIKFWSIDDKGNVKICRARFKRFLQSEGFCKYKIDGNYVFVRIENNIIEEIDSIDVKEFIMNYLRRIPIEELDGTNKTEIENALIKSANQLFTAQFLEFLITRNIVFNRDTYNRGYFYFSNGFVDVTKDEVQFRDYNELENAVWKKQVIDRDFTDCKNRTVFEEFLFNVCRKDLVRYNAFKSSIGYLLHKYKDPVIAKAVVFIDEKLSEAAYGRSGKGLLIKSLSKISSVVTEDGRNFNPSKNFAFQRLRADTDILAFEDIGEKFPFEKLFSIITDGITIERKNKDEIFIPYEDAPKIVLSTNYTIKGVDDSTLDRQFVIEFSDHYSMRHRPIDDFGKRFFEGWNNEDWEEFDNYMIECLQFYLKNGLLEYERVNLEQKRLIDETSSEFAEFAEEIELNRKYDKKELLENFKKENGDYDPKGKSKLTQGKFTRWLKKFGRIKGYKVGEEKSGAKRTIEFVILTPNPLPTKRER